MQRQQLAHVFEAGNFPLVYALGLKGAQLIAPNYWNAWRQNLHNIHWGFQNFRVLYETLSEARMQHMIAIQRPEEITPDGTNLFLFTTPERLKTHGILGPAWASGKGDTVSIAEDLLTNA